MCTVFYLDSLYVGIYTKVDVSLNKRMNERTNQQTNVRTSQLCDMGLDSTGTDASVIITGGMDI